MDQRPEASERAPRVSVVVPSRGGRHRLPVLFAAFENQTHRDFEVIIVLDGDIDESEACVSQYQANGDVTVSTIVFPENRGRVAALNAGFARARGRVLVRCDDDFEPRADYVQRHFEGHQGPVPVGLIGLAENVHPEGAYAASYGREADELFHAAAYATAPDARWRYWAGNVSVTRETYEIVGEYDPAFRAYGWEDVEWGYRLHRAGYGIVIDPSLSTPHHLASTSVRKRADRAYQSGAARRRFVAKHPQALETVAPDMTLWNTAVAGVSRLPRGSVMALASFVDVSLPRVPRPIGKKLAALVVEAAVVGGQRPGARENHSI